MRLKKVKGAQEKIDKSKYIICYISILWWIGLYFIKLSARGYFLFDIYIIVVQILVNIGIWYYILYFTNERVKKKSVEILCLALADGYFKGWGIN